MVSNYSNQYLKNKTMKPNKSICCYKQFYYIRKALEDFPLQALLILSKAEYILFHIKCFFYNFHVADSTIFITTVFIIWL